jgi:hypothetical protein
MLLCGAQSARVFVAAGACLAAAVSSELLWVVKGPFEALRSFPRADRLFVPSCFLSAPVCRGLPQGRKPRSLVMGDN